MGSKFIIAGNWKMNKSVSDGVSFVKKLNADLEFNENVDILIFPPAVHLYPIHEALGNIKLGIQNAHFEDSGAFTGETAIPMAAPFVSHVLIGHSERRQIFNEDDLLLNKKLKSTLRHNLIPVFCIGETLAQREAGDTFKVLEHQLKTGLADLNSDELNSLIIAYEPVWAIGTGVNASPEQAEEAHRFIKKYVAGELNIDADIPVLYGGSAKPGNSLELLSQKNISGLLIGGASLKLDQFFDIIHNSYKLI